MCPRKANSTYVHGGKKIIYFLGLVAGLKNLVDRPFQKFEKSRPTRRPDSTKIGRLWSTIGRQLLVDDHWLTTSVTQVQVFRRPEVIFLLVMLPPKYVVLIYLSVNTNQRHITTLILSFRSHSSANSQESWRKISSDACWGWRDARHLDIVNPADEKTRSEGADVAGIHRIRQRATLRW